MAKKDGLSVRTAKAARKRLKKCGLLAVEVSQRCRQDWEAAAVGLNPERYRFEKLGTGASITDMRLSAQSCTRASEENCTEKHLEIDNSRKSSSGDVKPDTVRVRPEASERPTTNPTPDNGTSKAPNWIPSAEQIENARGMLHRHRKGLGSYPAPDREICEKILRIFESWKQFQEWFKDMEARIVPEDIAGRYGIYLTDAQTFATGWQWERAAEQTAGGAPSEPMKCTCGGAAYGIYYYNVKY